MSHHTRVNVSYGENYHGSNAPDNTSISGGDRSIVRGAFNSLDINSSPLQQPGLFLEQQQMLQKQLPELTRMQPQLTIQSSATAFHSMPSALIPSQGAKSTEQPPFEQTCMPAAYHETDQVQIAADITHAAGLFLTAKAKRIDAHACEVYIKTSVLEDMLGFLQTGQHGTIHWTKDQHDLMHVVIRCLSRWGYLPPELCACIRRCFPGPDQVIEFQCSTLSSPQDSTHIRQLATNRSHRGGMEWYTIANCHGIIHYCGTIIKIGGFLHDIVNPLIEDGVLYSRMLVVAGHAQHSSNIVGSNVLKIDEQTCWQKLPASTCAAWHEQARDTWPQDGIRYSKQRAHDVAAMRKLAQSGAANFDAKGEFRIAMNAGHDERLCIGPATWTMDKAKEKEGHQEGSIWCRGDCSYCLHPAANINASAAECMDQAAPSKT